MMKRLMVFTEHLGTTAADARPACLPAPHTAAPSVVRHAPVHDRLLLPFERRQKTRQRAQLASGRDIGIQLPRGTVLRGGDRLRAPGGILIEVVAAPEAVSTVRSRSPTELARVAYHLGNRHVALQVGDGWVRYLTDHVLDAMVAALGLAVEHEQQAFEPEAGAYDGHRPSRDGAHSHTHDGGHGFHGHHDDGR